MISFATEFPVQHGRCSSEFLRAVRSWILASPHAALSDDDLVGIDQGESFLARKGADSVESLRVITGTSESCAVRHTKLADGLEWTLTAVLSRDEADTWIGARLSCESHHPAARLPPAKKPILVQRLLDALGGGDDGSFLVDGAPIVLQNTDIDLAARCITGRSKCRLPIVYVSSSFHDGHTVDPRHLAKSLAGMAHVLVEPNRPFSNRLKLEVESANVYGGTVGVYWPEGSGRRAFFLGSVYDSSEELAMAVIEEVRIALTNRRPLSRCTWASVQEAASRRAFEALKTAGSTEIEKYVTEFDKELGAKDERLKDAEQEIDRLRAQMRKYEAIASAGVGLALKGGEEQELYGGELGTIIMDAIADAGRNAHPDSRRKHVLSAVIKANQVVDQAKLRRDQLKESLRHYRSMDAKARKGLEELGFSFSDDGKHWKIVFQGDDRYTFTLAKTASDHRAGLNAAGDIARLLF